MKFSTVAKNLVLGLALVLASNAFAASKNTVTFQNPTNVNGTKLKAGEYTLQWDGAGPNVEVSFLQGKAVVAKTSARVIDLTVASANTAAVVKYDGEGAGTLTGLRFGGKKFALEVGDSGDGMQAGSSK